jgi:hypothetical protein
MRDFCVSEFEAAAEHEMQILRDDGVYRHLRFKRAKTRSMYFDLVTWPGHLCFTGDMGTYVFSRLTDMFEFFRRADNREPYQISFDYWGSKVLAEDRYAKVKEFCPDTFKAAVRECFEEDSDRWSDMERAEIWEEIEGCVLSQASAPADENAAFIALLDFHHNGFRFDDWDCDCKRYTHHFLWCCHAIQWGIGIYDAAKAGEVER